MRKNASKSVKCAEQAARLPSQAVSNQIDKTRLNITLQIVSRGSKKQILINIRVGVRGIHFQQRDG